MLSVFYGYFRRVIGEAFSTLLVGLILYGFVAVTLCSILTSFELFWPYLENLGIIGFEYIDTFDEALAGVMILLIGIFAGQITLGIFGIVVGIGLDKLEGILSPSEERIVTYGDFTSEGVTKAGVIKVRVIGTVPESLYKWMKQEIEAGNYVNQSHIMETALRQLKRKEK